MFKLLVILFVIKLYARKDIFKYFFHFINIESICNIFKKTMTFIADVFLNLRTPENVVRSISKKPRFSGSLDK